MPPDQGYWCRYATDWTEVKSEWGLTMTQGEAEAVIAMLDTCDEPVEVEAERARGVTTPQPEPEGDAAAFTGRVRRRRLLESQGCLVAQVEGGDFLRTWFPAPGTGMGTVSCVSGDQGGQ